MSQNSATPCPPGKTSLDVAACLERVRHRDEEAARELVEYLYPLVFKLVRAYLPRRTSEDDLAQTVFMKIFANLGQYSTCVPLEHWVARIAINTCLNQLQAEKIRPELRWADLSEAQCQVVENLISVSAELPPDQTLAARELVEKLLAQLDPAERLLLTLLHLEGHSPREVQRITGWNGTLVRVRAFRARQKLKKHCQKLLGLSGVGQKTQSSPEKDEESLVSICPKSHCRTPVPLST